MEDFPKQGMHILHLKVWKSIAAYLKPMRFVSLQNNQVLPNKSKLYSFTLNSGVDIEDNDIIRTDRSKMRGFKFY